MLTSRSASSDGVVCISALKVRKFVPLTCPTVGGMPVSPTAGSRQIRVVRVGVLDVEPSRVAGIRHQATALPTHATR